MSLREIQIKLAPHEKLLRKLAMGAAVIAVLASWIPPMFKARGDFVNHWEFGRRLVAGEFIYANGLNLPYPPFWALFFAPLSMLPQRVAMPLFFIAGFAALVALFAILVSLTKKGFAAKPQSTFWIITAILVVLSRFVLRDLADSGANFVIVAATWGGIYYFIRGKKIAGGALLGFAIALKCTPLLFAGYFFLKRQWSAVFWTLAFAIMFFLSPIVVMGQKSYSEHMAYWKSTIVAGVSQKDPSVGVLGKDELANKSLRPMLARYLMQLPADHPGRARVKGYVDFLRLSSATANIIVKLVTYGSFLVIIGLFILRGAGMDSPVLLWECSIMSILMLLYSPITWGQHCVALIPAAYFIALRLDTGKPVARWIRWTLWAVVLLFLIVNRSILGGAISDLAESCHFITFCLIVIVAVSLAFWKEARNLPTES